MVKYLDFYSYFNVYFASSKLKGPYNDAAGNKTPIVFISSKTTLTVYKTHYCVSA